MAERFRHANALYLPNQSVPVRKVLTRKTVATQSAARNEPMLLSLRHGRVRSDGPVTSLQSTTKGNKRDRVPVGVTNRYHRIGLTNAHRRTVSVSSVPHPPSPHLLSVRTGASDRNDPKQFHPGVAQAAALSAQPSAANSAWSSNAPSPGPAGRE